MLSYWWRVVRWAFRETLLEFDYHSKGKLIRSIILTIVALLIVWLWSGGQQMNEEARWISASIVALVVVFLGIFASKLFTTPFRMEQDAADRAEHALKPLEEENKSLREQLADKTTQSILHTSQWQSALEYVEPERLTIDVGSMETEEFKLEQGTIRIWLLHALVNNRLSVPISITAWLKWEFRLTEGQQSWHIPLQAFDPPTGTVQPWISNLEKRAGRSYGSYLQFPLKIDPGTIKGYMILSNFNDPSLEQLSNDPRFKYLGGIRLYLEWTEHATEKMFRKALFNLF